MVVRATLPRGGGEGKEPPQGNRPRRGAHPAEGRCIPVRVRARAGAALRSLTVPCNAVGRLTVVGEAVAWDGSALCSPAAARVSPRCTHPSPKVATHRSTGPRRVKRSLRLGVLATLPMGRARGPRLTLAQTSRRRWLSNAADEHEEDSAPLGAALRAGARPAWPMATSQRSATRYPTARPGARHAGSDAHPREDSPPPASALDLSTILRTVGDPVRLEIVRPALGRPPGRVQRSPRRARPAGVTCSYHTCASCARPA
jgi:hypothetical protein